MSLFEGICTRACLMWTCRRACLRQMLYVGLSLKWFCRGPCPGWVCRALPANSAVEWGGRAGPEVDREQACSGSLSNMQCNDLLWNVHLK